MNSFHVLGEQGILMSFHCFVGEFVLLLQRTRCFEVDCCYFGNFWSRCFGENSRVFTKFVFTELVLA